MTEEHIFLTEHWLHSGEFSSWKRFIMWSVLLLVVQRKRVLRSSWTDWMSQCNLSCKIVKNCRTIVLNRAKKILSEVCMIKKKTAPHSTVYLRSDVQKVYLQGWFTRHQICHQDLLALKVNLSKPALFLILASHLDRGMRRVNFWLLLRTILCWIILNFGVVQLSIVSPTEWLERLWINLLK